MKFPKGSNLEGSAQPADSKAGRSDPKGITDLIGTSIIKTIKYSDHFGFPLTASEIHLRLISSEPCSLERVFGTLQLMLKSKMIQQTQDYYHLPGKKSLVARRSNHLKSSKPQLLRAITLSKKISHAPFIKAIYLTGSLAMNNSKNDSDIDFMIITAEGKLWTTRFILTILTTLLGLRRTPHSINNSGKLCLNLYLTPDSYLLPTHKQSIYTAYELIQAVPVYDPSDTRDVLLAANPWIKKYLSNVITGSDLDGCAQPAYSKAGRSDPKGLIRRPGQTLSDTIEYLLFHLQYFYMRPKLTREYITINSAFFHPLDPSPPVLKV
jgi:predicted nucleotidyltransferase